MKQRIEDRRKSIDLRKQGLSYKEIMAIIPVSKSTLSGWLRNLELSISEENFLKDMVLNNQDRGRVKSSLTNRAKRLSREDIVKQKAKDMYLKYKSEPQFLAGIGLYWAEGSKRTHEFQFINSDLDMIVLMVDWVERYLGVQKDNIKYRLFTHINFIDDDLEKVWADKIRIDRGRFLKTTYKPTSHGVKKNPEYKGCLRISVSGIDSLRKMKYLIEEYKVDLLHS